MTRFKPTGKRDPFLIIIILAVLVLGAVYYFSHRGENIPYTYIELPSPPSEAAEPFYLTEYWAEPIEMRIEPGTIAGWVAFDDKTHEVSCSKDGEEVFTGTADKNELAAYSFNEIGLYHCVDLSYGPSMKVIVASDDEITGNVVIDPERQNHILVSILAFVIIIALSVFVYAKREIKRNRHRIRKSFI